MSSNPFNPKTNSHQDYETMKDLREHCTRCELKSSQAKTWQTWRDAYGIQFAETSPGSGRYDIRKHCTNCNATTVHRQLATLERNLNTSARSGISSKLATKIKVLLKYEEAFWLRQLAGNLLEVDHKFPQIRWNIDEEDNENATDEELIAKFILLTRSNNLLKSRNCERCVKTNKRGNFPGIYFWYEGDENWTEEPHNEKGCIGCFWYDPYKWREELNKIITSS
jgi:ICEA Protein